MKNFVKKIGIYACIYLLLVFIFVTLMYISYKLPNGRVWIHVEESVAQIAKEGNGYIPFFNQTGALMDTHTDALMLNIALNKGMYEGQGTLAKSVENSFYEEDSMVKALDNSVHSHELNNHEYSRYWHGIQVFLRPLLLFFNYSEIRYILMIITTILLGIAFYLIGKYLGLRYAIAFALTISFMYVNIIAMSLQYSCMYIITLLATITVCLLYKYKKEKYITYFFFIIGAIATYFDLLTYPLITMGIPLVVTLLFENRKKTDLLNMFLKAIHLGILWAMGYGLLFFTKWVIASIILQKNAIAIALDAILFRVNGNEQYPVVRMEVLKSNFECFFVPIAKFIILSLTIAWICLFIFFRKKASEFKAVLPLLCIAIVPYLWYIVFAGHSSIHMWFTYRIQAVTAFSILTAMCLTIKDNFNKTDI